MLHFKVFVGLGRPYEGPAALEAIANGAVFLNPRYAERSKSARDVENIFRVRYLFNP